MALVKLGGGVVEMRGSIGGTVFSRNRFGAYARNRSKPVNPNTPRQQAVRSIIALLRSMWFGTLTQDQRDAWASYADNVPMMNRLGETQHLTGYNMFCRTNAVGQQNGLALIANAPTEFSLAEMDPTLAIAPTVDDGKIAVSFDRLLPWAAETGGYMVVYQGLPCDKTINFFKGPWRRIGNIAGVDGAAPSSPQSLSVAYPIAVGQKQFVQCRILRKDGRLSSFFRANAPVAGTPLVDPTAAGVFTGGVLTTTITFPQDMNQDVLPSPGDFAYTGGACTNLKHTGGVWTSATVLTLTVTPGASPEGTGELKYIPGTIPLLTLAGGMYGGFEVEEIAGLV